MRVGRIYRQPYAGDPLDGEGARVFGGRWNSIGVRMTYCSGSAALAALEALVHFDTDIIPNDLTLLAVEITLEASVAALPDEALPARWREYSAAPESQAIGGVKAWIGAAAEVGEQGAGAGRRIDHEQRAPKVRSGADVDDQHLAGGERLGRRGE